MSPPIPNNAESGHVAHLPDDPVTPVVVSVPHAGTATGGFAAPLAADLDVRCDADLHVDRLYEGLPRGSHVRALLSRFVCDLNRHPDDVSRAAVPDHPAPRNTDGRGFIWAVTTTGVAAQARPLTLGEWQARQAVHAAYHADLVTALDRARAKFGFAVLVDGHSMPSLGKSGHVDTGRRRADVVPGDRDGASCAPALSVLVGDVFRARGYQVAFNAPYKGGYITTRHGRPSAGIHAIQIEVRRDLYMDEATYRLKDEGGARLRGALGDLLATLDGFDLRGAAVTPQPTRRG